MNVLDLFSGIGGFSLGLERAGMRTVAFCEIEPYARAVLRKHWPDVPCYPDVRELSADRLAADGIVPDVICGGFPCQDISVAGKGAGIEGERSGLWSDYARLIGELRPRYVIVENVSALLGRGLDRVLGDLAALGYDAEWHCIPAAAVGAPHRRDRLWAVAYPRRQRGAGWRGTGDVVSATGAREAYSEQRQRHGNAIDDRSQTLAYAEINGRLARRPSDPTQEPERRQSDRGGGGSLLADADHPRLEGWFRQCLQECAIERAARQSGASVSDTDSQSSGWVTEPWGERGLWLTEPDVGRVANGIPSRVDRLKGLGNAVVPQIPEIIGRAIMRSIND